ncbi:hypothetical protein RHSIM_Rhsim06G0228000 [Rhododendron simsii]|uniref:Uncharacterized protein n=1 Tax=Rhododendron simsii TaxID=118357 RepID=A0A834GQX4_RHOSS|nr:hypothetical protein RHSIM_Rhsim06G0228000 [Rhododendron simsii]
MCASTYEKRLEYYDRDMAKSDLWMALQLDPLRTYRYRAAVLMDDHKDAEAISELSKAITFKPDLQLLHLLTAFHDSMGDYIVYISTRRVLFFWIWKDSGLDLQWPRRKKKLKEERINVLNEKQEQMETI